MPAQAVARRAQAMLPKLAIIGRSLRVMARGGDHVEPTAARKTMRRALEAAHKEASEQAGRWQAPGHPRNRVAHALTVRLRSGAGATARPTGSSSWMRLKVESACPTTWSIL